MTKNKIVVISLLLACSFCLVAGRICFTFNECQEANAAETVSVAGMTVGGGIQGTDFVYGNVIYTRLLRGNSEAYSYQNAKQIATAGTVNTTLPTLTILTDKHLTLSGTTSANIRIAKGVHANITLAGLTCTGAMPINIETNSTVSGNVAVQSSGSEIQNKTSLNLYIQAGTTNSLQSSAFSDSVSRITYDYQFSGIRCGDGSVLTIDSTNPGTPDGKLIVRGGSRAAAIGGGPLEAAGNITVNGSTIDTKASGQYANVDAHGAGAGIGGGHGGSGGTITINGGNITAMGGFHGAPIGGGCTYNGGMSRGEQRTAPFADAILSTHAYRPLAGNITINGGYIRAIGTEHSNAFGKGCGNEGTNQIIRITGGTLLPSSFSGWYDIGLPNGYVIITGGSVHCEPNKFEGIGNTAYNTTDVATWNDIVNKHSGALPDSDKVFMVTVDMSSEGFVNDVIVDWELFINNEEQDYGSPYSFDNGKLYLWLPVSAVGSEVKVTMSIKTASGAIVTPGELFIPSVSNTGSVLKRYEPFTIPDGYIAKINKPYDGLPIPQYALSDGDLALQNTLGSNTRLTDVSQLKYTYQLYDNEGNLTGSAVSANATTMPSDAASYQLTLTSNEYSSLPGFSNSYWGHRQYVDSTITEVPSTASFTTAWKEGHEINHSNSPILVLTADITSGTFADGTQTAPTCKAPTGSFSVALAGNSIADSIPIVFEGEGKNAEIRVDENGREHTMLTYEITDTSSIHLQGQYDVCFCYEPVKNYLASNASDVIDIDTTVGVLPFVGGYPWQAAASNFMFVLLLTIGSAICIRRAIHYKKCQNNE